MTRVDVPPEDATTDGLPPRREQPDTWRVDVESLAFRVLASRRGNGASRPAIVLVHGIGVSHRYLSRLHDVLAQERDVYSIDLPGFAGLPKPGRDVDVPSMADALGLRDRVAATSDPSYWSGTRWGRSGSSRRALQRPAMVTDVVIMGPVADAAHRSMLAQSVALAADTLGETPEHQRDRADGLPPLRRPLVSHAASSHAGVPARGARAGTLRPAAGRPRLSRPDRGAGMVPSTSRRGAHRAAGADPGRLPRGAAFRAEGGRVGDPRPRAPAA